MDRTGVTDVTALDTPVRWLQSLLAFYGWGSWQARGGHVSPRAGSRAGLEHRSFSSRDLLANFPASEVQRLRVGLGSGVTEGLGVEMEVEGSHPFLFLPRSKGRNHEPTSPEISESSIWPTSAPWEIKCLLAGWPGHSVLSQAGRGTEHPGMLFLEGSSKIMWSRGLGWQIRNQRSQCPWLVQGHLIGWWQQAASREGML